MGAIISCKKADVMDTDVPQIFQPYRDRGIVTPEDPYFAELLSGVPTSNTPDKLRYATKQGGWNPKRRVRRPFNKGTAHTTRQSGYVPTTSTNVNVKRAASDKGPNPYANDIAPNAHYQHGLQYAPPSVGYHSAHELGFRNSRYDTASRGPTEYTDYSNYPHAPHSYTSGGFDSVNGSHMSHYNAIIDDMQAKEPWRAASTIHASQGSDFQGPRTLTPMTLPYSQAEPHSHRSLSPETTTSDTSRPYSHYPHTNPSPNPSTRIIKNTGGVYSYAQDMESYPRNSRISSDPNNIIPEDEEIVAIGKTVITNVRTLGPDEALYDEDDVENEPDGDMRASFSNGRGNNTAYASKQGLYNPNSFSNRGRYPTV